MSVTAVVFLVTSSLYAGFQATIRFVVYPQLARVPDPDFVAYETAHQRLVSRVVGPLFAAQVAAATALVVEPPAAHPRALCVLAAVLVAAILVITATLAVPLHRRLSHGYDAATHRRLLAVDSARVVVSIASLALAAYLVSH